MIETLTQLLLNTLKSFPKDDFMLSKKGGAYVPLSTGEFGDTIKHLSLGLRALGLGRGDKLAIISENRPEWVMTDFAALARGAMTVPIYTTLVPEQVRYIIDDSDAVIVVCSNREQWAKIEAVRERLGKVRHFIAFLPEAPEGVLTLDEVLDMGRRADAADPGLFEREALLVKPEDQASLIYTSGTTGMPKGVILTHRNFVSNIVSVAEVIRFSEKDTVLSFLPLSHVLERMVTFTYIYRGCSIGYAESVETVAQNLLEIRPHIMVSVPRVFEKIYAKVMDNVLTSSGLKRKLVFWAVAVGKDCGAREIEGRPIPALLGLKRAIARTLVFSKVVQKTGGRVRFFVSGGAPLSRDIAEFFYAMGLVILEGYGLTETAPVLSANTFEAIRFGTVGKPLPGVEIRIAPDGEILARGPNVMKGYYKKEAETREVFENGWFKTGDIGHLDEDGYLVITDRKKDLIVTSGGKNIAPQPIENTLKTIPYITTAVVIGDRKRFVAALIVPNFEKIEQYARSSGIAFADRSALVRNPAVVDFVKAEIDRATPGLAPYERIKKIALLDRDFEIEKDEITPSLKVKRSNVENRYRDVIDAMYAEEGGDGRNGNG
ncbi:MAG: AMP-dependent synthetase/ligase [Candidatus Aminicenantales bacterium]